MTAVDRPGLRRLRSIVRAVADSVGTPFYAYDAPSIDRATSWLLSASEKAGLAEARFYLAFFAAPNTALFKRVLRSNDRLGITCNTLEEIVALRKAGWADWQRVVFSGGVLPAGDIEEIARAECTVHAASPGNLEQLRSGRHEARVGVRISFDDRALKGFRYEEAREALQRRAATPLVSAHAYPGTEVYDPEKLLSHARQLIELVSASSDIEEINFGGGFWYNYRQRSGDMAKMFDFDRYFAHIADELSRCSPGRPVRPAWEPGRVVFAESGFFVASVVEVVDRGRGHVDVYLDASFTQIPAPKIRDRQHLVVALDPTGRPREAYTTEARLCGITTLSTDQLLPQRCAIPYVQPNDLIVILDVGAYGRAGSYSFLGRAKPPEILMEQGSWRVIRERGARDHLNEGVMDAIM